MGYRESVVSIGNPIPLHGVETVPQGMTIADTTLVILNSGLLHHVGSCLLSVRLARAAAALGMRSVRIDFSGIGDSAPRSAGGDHEQLSIDETVEVLAHAEHHWDSEQFVIAGLCSGAFAAFDAALLNHKVVGIAGIAPFGYRTRRWYLNHYGDRLFSARSWAKLARRLTGQGGQSPDGYGAEYLEASANIGWDVPPRERMQAGYQTLLERGVRFLHTFTGGESDYYNYEGQMRDMYPELDFGQQLIECHLPKARHIITEPVYQQQVLEQTQAWIAANWL